MTTDRSPPLTAEQVLQQAVAHHQAGRLQDAESLYRAILQTWPTHPDANHNLGVLAAQMNQVAAGLPYFKAALEADPTQGQYWLSYAEALLATGQAGEALNLIQDAMQRGLDTPAAQALLQKATKLLPDDARAHHIQGNALNELGQFDGAVASFRRALEIKPDFAEAHSNLGNALRELGRLDDAVTSYRRALEIQPYSAEAHCNLGASLKDLGQLDAAVASYRRALEIRPDLAVAHYNLGNALKDLGRFDGAVASYRRVLEINPDFVNALINLGAVLHDIGQLDGAVESYRRALEINPDHAVTHCNLGTVLRDLGQLDAAVASYRRALEIKPDYANAYSKLLFIQAYHALIDPHAYLALARGWERASVPEPERLAARHRVFRRPPLAGRRLRVGYVSGDYRQHVVSYSIEPVFAHHDRSRIELFAYSTNGMRDAVTDRLQALAEHWIPVMGVPDGAVRDRIEADGIDVLVDLSGHTAHNRMGVFARRAAPVQVYYLGYVASTGLTEMDYLLGDEILTPPETDSHFSERVWRLPRIWASYDGKAEAPLPDWRPSRDGNIWLGSFNNLGKLTPVTLSAWAKVLHALPEGKLLLKTKELSDSGNRRRILDAMAAHGIAADRIELRDSGATPGWPAHMAYYDRVDIALDPVGGMGGGITTCDALWMGVPVIALEGDRMTSRVAADMVDAVGHPEWIARSEAEYIDKIVALARDVERRKALRPGQRERVAASPLCDAEGLTRTLENAYFEMFERWLDGSWPDLIT